MNTPRAHPPIELGALLEAGVYTRIGGVSAPPLVAAGENVPVGAAVTNLAATPIYIAMTAQWDSTEFFMLPDYVSVPAGESHQFGGFFVMPPKSVTVRLYAFYWTGSAWFEDDQYSLLVSLQPAPTPTFSNLSATYRRVP